MDSQKKTKQDLKEANTFIALGVGVGALGAVAAVAASAVCPICVVVSPALIGIGLSKRNKVKDEKTSL